MSQRDFARVREALKPYHVTELMLAVLTLDHRAAGDTLESQYRGLFLRWKALRQLLSRGWSRRGFPGVGRFLEISTVEAHRNGRPHMNVIIISHDLADYLREHPSKEPRPGEMPLAPRWFRELAAHAGWGYRCTLGYVRMKGDVASYVTKLEKGLAMPHPTHVGEVVKLSQLPVLAPRRTRRLRASPGLLPPSRLPKNEEDTGKLFLHPPPEVMVAEQRAAMAELVDGIWGARDARAARKGTQG